MQAKILAYGVLNVVSKGVNLIKLVVGNGRIGVLPSKTPTMDGFRSVFHQAAEFGGSIKVRYSQFN